MFKLEIIGNLGADAVRQTYNGREFLSFRVADTNKWTDTTTGEVRETTTWVSCALSYGYEGVLPYLKTGTKVFVRGNASLRLYSSPKTHQFECGINCQVSELELCGGSRPADGQPQELAEDVSDSLKKSKKK